MLEESIKSSIFRGQNRLIDFRQLHTCLKGQENTYTKKNQKKFEIFGFAKILRMSERALRFGVSHHQNHTK